MRRLVRSFVTAACLPFALMPGASRTDAAVLTFVEAQLQGVGGVQGLLGARSVAVSPDGAYIYVASNFSDAVAVFARDPATGALSFVEAKFDGVGGVDGLNGPSGTHSVTVSPDGENVYVAGALDNALAVFGRDPVTGALEFIEMQRDGIGAVNGLAGSWGVTVSPDGAHVYGAGFADQAIPVFERDALGALHFIEFQKNGLGGVTDLDDP